MVIFVVENHSFLSHLVALAANKWPQTVGLPPLDLQ